jgi:hypothetical protein
MITDMQIIPLAAQLGRGCSIVEQRRFAARQFSGVRLILALDGDPPEYLNETGLTLPGYLVADAQPQPSQRLDLLLIDDPTRPFDPEAWLSAFEVAGGWYVITGDDNVNVGWRVFGSDHAAQIEARALYNEIANDPDRRRHVRAFILNGHRGLQPATD